MSCGSGNCPDKDVWAHKPHSKTGKYSEELEEFIAECKRMDPPVIIDPALAFEGRITRAGLDYWLSKAATGNVPDRAAIQPAEIARYLPYLALVDATEADDGGLSLFSRLAGEEFERVYGPIRQKDLSQHLDAPTYYRWCVFVRTMFAANGPVRLKTRIAHESKTYLNGEFLLAPLRTDMPEKTTVLVFAEFRTDS